MLGPDARFPRPFGDHLLLRRLAAGGMAEVFEARASGPGGFEKRVALKRLLPEHQGDAELVRALVREARLGAMLSHPNLCRVDALGAVDGVWFFTLELVDGLDLYRLHRRFRRHDLAFPIELALHVVAGVARGLHHAHDARNAQGRALRVVHRDVSPQNVLVGRDGRVKVVDFGIARTGLHRTRTARGIVKGKWAYMSPEQARGARRDRRSDVYATGVLLYELVCGRLPPAPGCGGRNGSGGPRSRDGCSGPAGHRSRQLPWSRAAPAAPPAPPPARAATRHRRRPVGASFWQARARQKPRWQAQNADPPAHGPKSRPAARRGWHRSCHTCRGRCVTTRRPEPSNGDFNPG